MLLHLTDTEERIYRQVLLGVYEKEIRVELLDRTGDIIEDLTTEFQDGSVTIDTTRDVNRGASIQILDARHRFGFDADTYYGADLDLSRLMRATWVTDSELLANPVRSDLILGPVTGLNREGVLVTCEVQSMEALLMRRARRTMHIKKGNRITDALRKIANEYLPGWTRISIPDLPRKLSEDVTIHPKDQPWRIMTKLAEALNRHLFCDRSGVLRLREYGKNPVWTWKGGINGTGLVSDLSTSADMTDLRNVVYVEGRTPKHQKKPVSWTAVADSTHQFSAAKIGVQKESITNRHCRTVADCRALAERVLADRLTLGREVSYDVAPIPDLDELDIVRAITDEETVRHRLRSAVIPLGGGTGDDGPKMQIGYTGPYRRRKRKHKGGKG